VNGIPSCANQFLLDQTARQKWQFDGYVTGDCGAVDCVQNAHHYTNNPDDTCLSVLKAGLDIDCGGFLPGNVAKAVSNGKVSMDLVNTALSHLFRVQMRLGMFDSEASQPYLAINVTSINTPAHQRLALTGALEGIVLIKNNGTLPLAKSGVVAVIGPNARATNTMQGNYYGNAPYLVSPLDAISKFVRTVYSQGSDLASQDTSKISAACDAARGAAAAVVIAGLDGSQENEGHDRNVLTWPGVQEQLIQRIATCNSKVILVVFGGGPIDLTSVRDNPNIEAILWAGYPGQSGGDAIAQIIFGDVSPSGRLPHTVYPAAFANQVGEDNMAMRPSGNNPGRTYRFYAGDPVYPFGTGLSYTTFNFAWSNTSVTEVPFTKIQSQVSKADYTRFTAAAPLASMTCVVTNTGQRPSDVVVLAFMSGPNPGKNGNPIKTLIGFERVRNLAAGQKSTVNFPITAHDLSLVNQSGNREAQAGVWKVIVEDAVQEINVI